MGITVDDNHHAMKLTFFYKFFYFSCQQLSHVSEDGRYVVGELHRKDILQRRSDKVFRPEATEGLCETELVGKMREARVQEAGASPRQRSLLMDGTHFFARAISSTVSRVDHFDLIDNNRTLRDVIIYIVGDTRLFFLEGFHDH